MTILIILWYVAIVIGITVYAIKWRKRAQLTEEAFKGLLRTYQQLREETKTKTENNSVVEKIHSN